MSARDTRPQIEHDRAPARPTLERFERRVGGSGALPSPNTTRHFLPGERQGGLFSGAEGFDHQTPHDREVEAQARKCFLADLSRRKVATADELHRAVMEIARPAVRDSLATLESLLDSIAGREAGDSSKRSGRIVNVGRTLDPRMNGEHRPDYDSKPVDQADAARSILASMNVFNPAVSSRGEAAQYNLNLHWPELRRLRESVLRTLASGDTAVVLPFAYEPHTVARDIQYVLERVPAHRVIAVDAGVDPTAAHRAQELLKLHGNRLVSQAQVLRCIDWERLSVLCAVPLQVGGPGAGLPAGTKGLTMLAGLVAAAFHHNPGTKQLAFHDTDIANPGHYNALEYLHLPLAMAPRETFSACSTAKTGPGRNNQTQSLMANQFADSPDKSALSRDLATILGTLIWPLTGERMGRLELLTQMPWTTGMSIETQWNAFFAGRALAARDLDVAQICNPHPKREDRPVAEDREFLLMDRCARWLGAVLEFTNISAKLPHAWGFEELKDFNLRFGGKNLRGYYQSAAHEAQVGRATTSDYMLPSVAQLDAAGLINREGLARLLA